ncbi:hypothetical protein [uncultured Kordia sp.]|uniref:hypothetical protein n=1 Tax=uncultured Kordia sp. TaxID=507699 RepID=UPI0026040C22|nr:hypothetical protein [uncultured Kordia sp.]
MKKLYTFLVLTMLLNIQFITAQESITPPTEGKSVVYIIRTTQAGSLINFKYFDGEKYLGKFNGRHYFRYECNPGKHTFWAKSENIDFIEADLKANSVYFIEAKARMGMIKASVKLFPVDFTDKRQMKKINKIFKKKDILVRDTEKIAEEAVKLEERIQKWYKKIAKKKEKGRKVKKITPEMEYKKL